MISFLLILENCNYGFPALILNETAKCSEDTNRRTRRDDTSDKYVKVKIHEF